MHIHILGICGTFMGGIAALAQALGHKVTGSDANVYPPMSTQLEALGISLYQGFDEVQFAEEPDLVIIGNAMSRGNPAVEYVLNRNLPYTSGPQWLQDNLLKDRWVLAAAHPWQNHHIRYAGLDPRLCGLQPGFLIGGIAQNFGLSARLGAAPFFVIEADEYDTAFFDKRSKFVHYRPRTLIINNLEFDHADIFADLAAIQTQFHHLVRMVPGNGRILSPAGVAAIEETLGKGCWSEQEQLGQQWSLGRHNADGSEFEVCLHGEVVGKVRWQLIGAHNMHNAVMAVAAARHAGVKPDLACEALGQFINAKRRMEIRGVVAGITVYDDFAHHPTAIETTLAGLRARVGHQRILAVLEPRSNTMKQGSLKHLLAPSWQQANMAFVFEPSGLDWSMQSVAGQSEVPVQISDDVAQLARAVVAEAQPGDSILVMSNGGFGGIHQQLLEQLEVKFG
ncbi:UDP-N-acetylmuramate:L-alanyl-gamma-D-glutamyl-meso-diaminopimelate ligase [Pseudobowmanella zhangzhouensis]|uniref:UDP-N-acetylmuramate:L-alanyl-gamma-D-glutamyl- meso-diaminopimelate ligase n=1 Tax=Pseudobowmanella zhangzhouensis TaxID=1537679 RepID=UPI00361B754B